MDRYNVYKIDSGCNYLGISLVAAENVDEANSFIQDFKDDDKNNNCDSRGYCFVEEDDIMDSLYSDTKGIIYYGIRYFG